MKSGKHSRAVAYMLGTRLWIVVTLNVSNCFNQTTYMRYYMRERKRERDREREREIERERERERDRERQRRSR